MFSNCRLQPPKAASFPPLEMCSAFDPRRPAFACTSHTGAISSRGENGCHSACAITQTKYRERATNAFMLLFSLRKDVLVKLGLATRLRHRQIHPPIVIVIASRRAKLLPIDADSTLLTGYSREPAIALPA